MKTMIAWFARNGVAANLLVTLIIVGGVLSLVRVKKEVFPEVDSDMISVSVVYPGAAPEEVEQAVTIRIEEAVQSLDEIRKISSTAAEGVGTVFIELIMGADSRQVLDDVKARVDQIDTFPAETEEPVIKEVSQKRQVLNVAVSAETDEWTLTGLAERVRDEIATIPGITQVEVANARPYEVSIEVSEADLRRHGLTFSEVAEAVRRSSIDLPGGTIRTEGGHILLRAKGQAYYGEAFERLALLTNPDGTHVVLKDVAKVEDGFAETDQAAWFDGAPSLLVQVFRVGDQSALQISEAVYRYVEEARGRMPEGVNLTVWQDDSSYLKSRLELLLRNGRTGLFLVFLTLALFLRFRLALWVTFGLLASFLGALWCMPLLGVSINLITLFAFILVLGILVDDAIVVSENIYTQQQRHSQGLRGAIEGTQEVVKPVIFAVLTTVAAFSPLLFVPGNTGKIMRVIPLVVIPALLFSLVESLFVLPVHLSHIRPEKEQGRRGPWRRFQHRFSQGLERFVQNRYRPFLERVIRWRYLTLATAVAALIATGGFVKGGWVEFIFFPAVEGDNMAAMVTMPEGTPVETTREAVRRLEASARELQREIDQGRGESSESVFRHYLASVGTQPFKKAQQEGAGNFVPGSSGSHLGEVHIELAPSEERRYSSENLANRWRELTGPIPSALELTFSASVFSPGEPINVQLTGPDVAELRRAADRLKLKLAEYPGVFEIADSFRPGKEEIKLHVKPSAEAIGLSLRELARQVRQAFYGEEAQRIQRGRHEVKVMVRYPEGQRETLDALHDMRIRTPDGREVPFPAVATAEVGRGYASIQRVDRHRAINVTADVDESKANANQILNDLKAHFLPDLLAAHPAVDYSLEGERREQRETMEGVIRGFILSMIIIYALLAIPFHSYIQPLLVMAAIPFGLVGAVWGHVLMGMDLTILSMFGVVALAGVVVNDNLVLVDFVNRRREGGESLAKAIREAGVDRFRPILLTSLTTFAGLTPLLLEKSVQAKFLVPMAVSLGFGVLFATVISLLMVPASYMILEDVKRGVARLFK